MTTQPARLPLTWGEAYADPSTGAAAKVARMAEATRPVHAEVDRLVSSGMDRADAWAQLLASGSVRP